MSRAAATCAVLWLAACGGSPATGVVVVVDADPDIATAATGLDVDVEGAAVGGVLGEAQHFPVARAQLHFPLRITIGPKDGDTSRRFDLRLTAHSATLDPLVTSHVVSGFAPSRLVELHVQLTTCCSAHPACGTTETCAPTGATTCMCRDATIDPTTLPDLDGGRTDAGGTDGGVVDAPLVDAPSDAPLTDAGVDLGVDANVDAGPPTCTVGCGGTYTWTPETVMLTAHPTGRLGPSVDLDHDGKKDVVIVDGMQVYVVRTIPGATCRTLTGDVGGEVPVSGPAVQALTADDSDLDGADDLVIVGIDQIEVVTTISPLSTSLYAFPAAQSSPKQAAARPSAGMVAYARPGAIVVVNTPLPGAPFVDPPTTSIATGVLRQLTVGNFDSDGLPDFIATQDNGDIIRISSARADSEMIAVADVGSHTLATVNFDGADLDEYVVTSLSTSIVTVASLSSSSSLDTTVAGVLGASGATIDGVGGQGVLAPTTLLTLQVLPAVPGPTLGTPTTYSVAPLPGETGISFDVSDLDGDDIMDAVVLTTIAGGMPGRLIYFRGSCP